MLKVLIFGGSGLVGSRIKELLTDKYKIIIPPHQQVDVTSKGQIEQTIKRSEPDYIVYAAGIASLDEAEKNPKSAYALNSKAPDLIARFAASFSIPVLYFSTDAVFNGLKSDKPYTEDDKPDPISEYGKSKLMGEQMVMSAFKRNCIVRIIMVYSHQLTKRKRFVQIVIDALKKGEKFYGVIDQVVNPLYVDDIVWAVDSLIKSKSYGIYHLGSTDYVSNYEFVKKIAKRFDLDENLVMKITFDGFSKEKYAPRSKFCWLDTHKFRKIFGDGILHSTDAGLRLLKNNLAL